MTYISFVFANTDKQESKRVAWSICWEKWLSWINKSHFLETAFNLSKEFSATSHQELGLPNAYLPYLRMILSFNNALRNISFLLPLCLRVLLTLNFQRQQGSNGTVLETQERCLRIHMFPHFLITRAEGKLATYLSRRRKGVCQLTWRYKILAGGHCW